LQGILFWVADVGKVGPMRDLFTASRLPMGRFCSYIWTTAAPHGGTSKCAPQRCRCEAQKATAKVR